jgi:putative membrane protein
MSEPKPQHLGGDPESGGGDSPVTDPRIYLAAERTLLAWIRTGLAMMGLGFVVARFGLLMKELAIEGHQALARHQGPAGWLGTVLVLLGVIVSAVATAHHVQTVERLHRGVTYRPSAFSLEAAVGVVLSIFGVFMALHLLAALR